MSWKLKSAAIGIVLLLSLVVGARALTPLFIGQVTNGFLLPGGVPDCYVSGYSTGPINYFLGELVTANIVENANNLPVITALGGNPVSQAEVCTSSGNLIEIACSSGYLGVNGIPNNYVGAIEVTPYDIDSSGNVRCEQYKTLAGNGINIQPTVVTKPAFFHSYSPGFDYVSPGNPSAIVTTNLNCPNLAVTATPLNQNRQIVNLWIEGPAPYYMGNSVVGMQNSCAATMPCYLSVTLPTSGTYHSYVEEYNLVTGDSILTVDSFYC